MENLAENGEVMTPATMNELINAILFGTDLPDEIRIECAREYVARWRAGERAI